jgi:Tol biopolymer transport system component
MQPIDKISLTLMSLLTLLIGGAIAGSKACGSDCFLGGPRVQNFSWQDESVGAREQAFTLTFDRPMNRGSVEANLVINPPLPGKVSWAGRRLAYTLNSPIPYGETYQVQLQDAQEQFRDGRLGAAIQPFIREFHSRDRAFAYIGIQGEERGRLIFYNLTQKRQTVLTPPDLAVSDFQFFPQGDRLLFAAAAKVLGSKGIKELQLYTVKVPAGKEKAGEVKQVLDSEDYSNQQFAISPDGETIVVQRLERDNPANFGLWTVKAGEVPKPLNVQGGEFTIAPDGQTLAVAKGEGISLLPLEPGASLLNFLPKFGQLLSFSPDGRAAAMVDFNTDDPKLRYQRSLFYVNNQGLEKELLTLKGSILDCKFNPQGTELYCLLSQLLDKDQYQEQSYLVKIDLKTAKTTPLAALPGFQDIQSSLAPDGLAILFDQVTSSNSPYVNDMLATASGAPIIDGRLWLLLPPPANAPGNTKPQVEALPLVGFHPQWMP